MAGVLAQPERPTRPGAAITGVAVMLLLFGMFWRGRTACFSVVLLHPVKACKKEGPHVRLTHGARHACERVR